MCSRFLLACVLVAIRIPSQFHGSIFVDEYVYRVPRFLRIFKCNCLSFPVRLAFHYTSYLPGVVYLDSFALMVLVFSVSRSLVKVRRHLRAPTQQNDVRELVRVYISPVGRIISTRNKGVH